MAEFWSSNLVCPFFRPAHRDPIGKTICALNDDGLCLCTIKNNVINDILIEILIENLKTSLPHRWVESEDFAAITFHCLIKTPFCIITKWVDETITGRWSQTHGIETHWFLTVHKEQSRWRFVHSIQHTTEFVINFAISWLRMSEPN